MTQYLRNIVTGRKILVPPFRPYRDVVLGFIGGVWIVLAF